MTADAVDGVEVIVAGAAISVLGVVVAIVGIKESAGYIVVGLGVFNSHDKLRP